MGRAQITGHSVVFRRQALGDVCSVDTEMNEIILCLQRVHTTSTQEAAARNAEYLNYAAQALITARIKAQEDSVGWYCQGRRIEVSKIQVGEERDNENRR